MRKAALCLLTLAVLLTVGCASGRGYVMEDYDFEKSPRVAVVKVNGPVPGQAAREQLMGFLSMELLQKGFTVVERSDIQEVLSEQDFQSRDITRPEDAAKVGRLLNVDNVMILNVPTFGERISMTARMIDVEEGVVVWMGEGSGSTRRTLATITGGLLGAGAGIWAGGDRTGRVVGGIAGGVIGGWAGRTLSPAEANTARKVIGLMSEDLPKIR